MKWLIRLVDSFVRKDSILWNWYEKDTEVPLFSDTDLLICRTPSANNLSVGHEKTYEMLESLIAILTPNNPLSP